MLEKREARHRDGHGLTDAPFPARLQHRREGVPSDQTNLPDAKVGILAGGGELPFEVADGLAVRHRSYHIVGIDGYVGPEIDRHPHTRVGLGELGKLLRTFRAERCRDLVIIGSLVRPDLTRLRLDLGALWHAPAWLSLTRGGDDSLLRKVVRFFEQQGFRVLGAGDVVPSLLADEGVIAGKALSSMQVRSVAVGQRALLQLSRFDVGQAVVAAPEGIVAIEDGRGTARMLADLARAGGAPPDAVLVKLAKAGQELRVDTPTIGAETVHQAHEAGLSAIAIGAGTTLVAQRDECIRAALQTGVSVAGVKSIGSAAEMSADAHEAQDAGDIAPDDRSAASALARCAAAQMQPAFSDVGVVVRGGHAIAIMADGCVNGTWPEKLADLPNGWRLPLIGRRQTGALAVAVRRWAPNDEWAMLHASRLMAAARSAGLVTVEVAPVAGCILPQTVLRACADAARREGITFISADTGSS